jgi:hypothetical protein|tara:strand:+ start:4074 stop:4181 length:108 start_codon:yes stop_codon:yes gene_type:complete
MEINADHSKRAAAEGFSRLAQADGLMAQLFGGAER